MFFLSKEARRLYEIETPLVPEEIAKRVYCEKAVLWFGNSAESIVRSHGSWPPGPFMADIPRDFQFERHIKSYLYITEEYVTHDYDRITLVAIVSMIRQYDFEVIRRLGDKAKSLGKYTIPYLAAMVTNEASEVIEEIRLEARLEQLVNERPDVELPPYRPTDVRTKMEALAQDRKFDEIIKGK